MTGGRFCEEAADLEIDDGEVRDFEDTRRVYESEETHIEYGVKTVAGRENGRIECDTKGSRRYCRGAHERCLAGVIMVAGRMYKELDSERN